MLPSTIDVRVDARAGCSNPFPGSWHYLGSTPITYSNACSNNSQQIGGGGNPNDGGFKIDLLPNPAQNNVTVKFDSGGKQRNIRILDNYGNERKNVNSTAAAENIYIGDLPLGSYSVIATEGSDVATEHLQVVP